MAVPRAQFERRSASLVDSNPLNIFKKISLGGRIEQCVAVRGRSRGKAEGLVTIAAAVEFGLYSADPARLVSVPMLILATQRTKTIKKPIGGLLEVCVR